MFTQDGTSRRLEKVEISLSDCLACSGCITSAESVLITQQSREELQRVFVNKQNAIAKGAESEAQFIVVSVSVQPVLSLANRFQLTYKDAAEKLNGYFRQLGADMILDMNLADDIALLENQREFIQRFRAVQSDPTYRTNLPMLTSSCPGWICYAEKTHGNFILPYISTVKSPQQIIGTFVKDHIANKIAHPRSVYHIAVMPCYDKKLEASRPDFFNHQTNSRDIDCVITASKYLFI